MKLEDKINDPYLNSKDLRKMLANVSEVSVNWIGSRIIAIKEYDGTVALDEIAEKVLTISQQPGLQERERTDLLQCETALTGCYERADAQWQESNPITLSIGYVSRVVFEGHGNSFTPNFGSTKWRILDHEVSDNLKKNTF